MVQQKDGTLTPIEQMATTPMMQPIMMPNGQMMHPGMMQFNPVMVPQGPAELDPADRRKLIKEIKDEVKPMISQIADFQIEKANAVIKTSIRKIENEITHENNKIHDKIGREILATKELAAFNLKTAEKEIKDMIRDNAKQRARDKADNDIRHNRNEERLILTEKKLSEHHDSFSALAVVTSMLIENINMQMEAEMADLLDRRMMSLFGVAPTKVDKLGVQNVSETLKNATKGITSKSPSPQRYEETGLPSIQDKRGSLGIGNVLNDSIDEPTLKTSRPTAIRDIHEEY